MVCCLLESHTNHNESSSAWQWRASSTSAFLGCIKWIKYIYSVLSNQEQYQTTLVFRCLWTPDTENNRTKISLMKLKLQEFLQTFPMLWPHCHLFSIKATWCMAGDRSWRETQIFGIFLLNRSNYRHGKSLSTTRHFGSLWKEFQKNKHHHHHAATCNKDQTSLPVPKSVSQFSPVNHRAGKNCETLHLHDQSPLILHLEGFSGFLFRDPCWTNRRMGSRVQALICSIWGSSDAIWPPTASDHGMMNFVRLFVHDQNVLQLKLRNQHIHFRMCIC